MLTTELEVSSVLQELLQVAADQSAVALPTVVDLSQALLALPESGIGKRGGRSGLNHDGSPLQVCLSSTSQGVYTRLLADPAFVLADPYERYVDSRAAFERVLRLTRATELLDLCDRTLSCYVPNQRSEFDRFDSGVLWLGAGLQMPGCALYVDARQRQVQSDDPYDAAWTQAQVWLNAILPDATEANAAIAALRSHGELLSIGIEGSKLSNARAKLYWRFKRPTRLDQIEIEILNHPAFVEFLIHVIADRTLLLSGIVPSIGFSVTTGNLLDAKLDICGHCLAYHPTAWAELIQACTQCYGLAPLSVASALSQSQVSYIGLGLDHNQQARLNLYLKTAALWSN
jgi:hypothetical protein